MFQPRHEGCKDNESEYWVIVCQLCQFCTKLFTSACSPLILSPRRWAQNNRASKTWSWDSDADTLIPEKSLSSGLGPFLCKVWCHGNKGDCKKLRSLQVGIVCSLPQWILSTTCNLYLTSGKPKLIEAEQFAEVSLASKRQKQDMIPGLCVY